MPFHGLFYVVFYADYAVVNYFTKIPGRMLPLKCKQIINRFIIKIFECNTKIFMSVSLENISFHTVVKFNQPCKT